MGFIGNVVDSITGGKKAGKAARKGAETTAAGIEEAARISAEAEWGAREAERGGEVQARDYLMQQNEMDRAGSQGAKSRLMGMYGIGDNAGFQNTLIQQAQDSPLYAAMQGTRQAGEDAIMRNAAATGGLRSGNVQSNMYDYNQRLDERSLLEAYNQQLGGLQDIAGWQTNENNIAGAMLRPGETTAEALRNRARYQSQGVAEAAQARGLGTVAEGQAIQSGRGGAIDAAAGFAGAKWSDRRLKDDVIFMGNDNGINIYAWTWNKLAEALGMVGAGTGVMADEIEISHPHAVGTARGYKTVNYDQIGV